MGGPQFFPPIGIFLLMLPGSPCKNSEPFDKPFWDIFEISPFSDHNRVNSRGRGGPRIFFLIGILLFMLLGGPHTNFEPYDKPFWNIFENSPFSSQNRVK